MLSYGGGKAVRAWSGRAVVVNPQQVPRGIGVCGHRHELNPGSRATVRMQVMHSALLMVKSMSSYPRAAPTGGMQYSYQYPYQPEADI